MVLAHAGDWVANAGFAAPAVILVIGVAIAKLRERRRLAREDRLPEERP